MYLQPVLIWYWIKDWIQYLIGLIFWCMVLNAWATSGLQKAERV